MTVPDASIGREYETTRTRDTGRRPSPHSSRGPEPAIQPNRCRGALRDLLMAACWFLFVLRRGGAVPL